MITIEVTSSERPTPEAAEAQANMQEALDRFQLAKESSSDDRNNRLGDLKFRSGDQWPDNIIQDRANDSRPALTINRLPHFIRLVTNDMRQNRPEVTVSPTDGEATEETADIMQGMIRHIEYDSHADFAYDTAADAQCIHGLGYFRVVTEYESHMSFDQVIKIKRIRNSFRVYVDPACQEPDFSDARYMFLTEDIELEDFKRQFPNSKLSGGTHFQGEGNHMPDWITTDSVRVAEYFKIVTRPATIWLLDDRTVREESELPKGKDGKPAAPEGRRLMGSRKTHIPKIVWQKINGIEVLEETEWLGKWIPIIPVMGDELDVDGKVIYEGIVRHAKDPQRMYNYWASAETETIALAPKAPFIGVEGQFEGHEDRWAEANRRNVPYLEYKPVSVGGVSAPAPERNMGEPPVRAITQARQLAGEDLKATTGTFDPAMGAQGNETSGRAILARQQQHSTTNYHYADNMSRAIRHLGRILVDLIPKVYDAERVVRIVAADGNSETVTINRAFMDKGGIERLYDVRKGKYDVVVAAGPSYNTKRQETVATMMQLASAWPQIVQIAGDLMVKNMDWKGASEIAERMKKMLPPELQDQSDITPAAKAMLDKQKNLINMLTEALNKTTTKLQTKVLDIESKERIALNRNLTELTIVNEQMHADASANSFHAMVQHIENQLDRVGGNEDPQLSAQQGAGQLSPTVAAANAAANGDADSSLQQPAPMGQP